MGQQKVALIGGHGTELGERGKERKSVSSLGARGIPWVSFFHTVMRICYRSKLMARGGAQVEVEMDLRSSLSPSWKELNSAKEAQRQSGKVSGHC